jgi:hypothetical protein
VVIIYVRLCEDRGLAAPIAPLVQRIALPPSKCICVMLLYRSHLQQPSSVEGGWGPGGQSAPLPGAQEQQQQQQLSCNGGGGPREQSNPRPCVVATFFDGIGSRA